LSEETSARMAKEALEVDPSGTYISWKIADRKYLITTVYMTN